MTLASTLKKPHVAGFIFCSLFGVMGLAFVLIGIGGGFVKPEPYLLMCNSTVESPVRLNCVAQWDAYAANSTVYTKLCLCERLVVNVTGPGSVVADSDVSSSDATASVTGKLFSWQTRRKYNRTYDCSIDYPDDKPFACFWYPDGDEIDRESTLYSYDDKTDFRAANAVFAVGILITFIATMADCFVVFTKMSPAPCKT